MAVRENSKSDTIITGTSKADSITNSGSNVRINAGNGNDYVYNHEGADRVTISGGNGNDTIANHSNTPALLTFGGGIADFDGGVSISGGAGNDSIYNFGSHATIDSGSGNDTVNNHYNMGTKINTGSGDDYIRNHTYAHLADINAGAGNDYIQLGFDDDDDCPSDNVTISGGKGNDLIKLNNSKESVIKYASGDGNDTIYGYDFTDTLSLTSGSITDSLIEGNNLILKIGKGTITFVDALTVNVNDSILGNAGNDKLYGQSGNDLLKGGKGNDSLWGGKGNDSLWGDSGKDTFIYSAGEGKDVIYGFADNDMLKITGAFSASYSKSKNEVYFKVGTTSKAITLSDFSASSFNINGDIYQINGSKLVKK